MPASLYLASTSPYRRDLLARLQLPFGVVAPDVDEAIVRGEAPAVRAARLAAAKAQAVSSRHPAAWVIGSDQAAECEGQLLSKPGHAQACREQLAACSGRRVRFHTAFALIRAAPAGREEHVDLTEVHFRSLAADEIAAYVGRERPFDCAGGFRAEGLGIALFEGIDGIDPTALIGLPLIALSRALRRAGFGLPAPLHA